MAWEDGGQAGDRAAGGRRASCRCHRPRRLRLRELSSLTALDLLSPCAEVLPYAAVAALTGGADVEKNGHSFCSGP